MADKPGSSQGSQPPAAKPQQADLAAIKARVRDGKLTQDDVKRLEKIVASAEEAVRALRGAIVE